MNKLLQRAGIVTVAGMIGFGLTTLAWADTPIGINSGNVPTTAAGYGNHTCDANQGGGPYIGEDVWVFVLPGQHSKSGDFTSVTADFGGHGTITITAAGDPGDFANGGPAASKAWITTPSGWTLNSATASITGSASFFNLTHTCPASGPGPSPSPSASTSESPSPSPSESSSGSPSPSPSESSSSSPSPSPSASASEWPSPNPSESPSTSPSATTSTGPSPSESASASPSRSPRSSVGPTATSTGTIPLGGVPTGGGDSPSSARLIWGTSALVVGLAGGIALLALARRRADAR